jgi:hypothetical protein
LAIPFSILFKTISFLANLSAGLWGLSLFYFNNGSSIHWSWIYLNCAGYSDLMSLRNLGLSAGHTTSLCLFLLHLPCATPLRY